MSAPGALTLGLIWTAAPAVKAQQPAAAATPATPVMFDGVTVVDVEHGKLLPEQRVVVTGNRIEAVGSGAAVPMPKDVQVVDARGKYLIPGLWNMHVHMESHPQTYKDFITNGITGVREMSQSLGIATMHQWRDEIVAGTRVGPRTIGLDQRLFGEGGPEIAVVTPDDARRIVDSLNAAGADFIKVYSGLERDVFFAIAAEARRVGIPLVGHLQASITEIEASDSGQRSLEHVIAGVQLPCWYAEDASPTLPTECAAMAEHFIRNGTWFTPTLVRLDPYNNFDSRSQGCRPESQPAGQDRDEMDLEGIYKFGRLLDAVGRMHRAGILMLAASDGGRDIPLLGCSIHVELALLAEAGLSPLAALQTATLNPAKFLNATDSLGTVASGKLADLVLLDANPLASIHNTKKIRAVVANGRYFDRAALDSMVTELDNDE